MKKSIKKPSKNKLPRIIAPRKVEEEKLEEGYIEEEEILIDRCRKYTEALRKEVSIKKLSEDFDLTEEEANNLIFKTHKRYPTLFKLKVSIIYIGE